MPLTPEQKKLVIKGTIEYLVKKGKMERNYVAAKDRAIANYEKQPFINRVKENYRDAWNHMPAMYKLRIESLELVRNWIKEYSSAMFNVTLSDAEVDAIISEAKSELAKYGITVVTG